MVTFTSGSTVLGTASVDGNATATLEVSTLAANRYSVVATYGGDAAHAGSASTPASLNVVDFSIATPGTVSISAPGSEVSAQVTLTPIAGFDQTVSYSCSGLPEGAACSFAAGSDGATLTITTSAPQTAALGRPADREPRNLYAAALPLQGGREPRGSYAWLAPGFAPGFAGLIASGRGQRRRRSRRLAALALALSIAAIGSGCGGGGGHGPLSIPVPGTGTPQGEYTVTITATAGGLARQASFTLQVS
jgi:hypothetical protein